MTAMTSTANDEHYWGWGWRFGLPDREAGGGSAEREHDNGLRVVREGFIAASAGC